MNLKNLLPNIIKSVLPGSLGAVVDIFRKNGDDKTADAIANVFTKDEMKLEFEKLAMEKIQISNEYNLKLKDIEIEDLKSAREYAKNDNEFGTKLSRNVRPVILIAVTSAFLLLLFMMFSVSILRMYYDIGNADELINIFKTLLEYIQSPLQILFMFYFGARSIEKIGHEFNSNKKKE